MGGTHVAYHILGSVSSLIFCFLLAGFGHQLTMLLERGSDTEEGKAYVKTLSLNQIGSSLGAFLVFGVYGAGTVPFNHYIVWTRAAAVTMLVLILFATWRVRRDRTSALALLGAVVFAAAGVALVTQSDIVATTRIHVRVLSAVMAVVLAQGYIHQIIRIRKSGTTGAVSLRMHQMLFLKDFSTGMFGLTLGASQGWPLLLLGVNALIKLGVLWQFRWVGKAEVRV